MIRTLLDVMHIPVLARNLISISKISDAGVNIFENDRCKTVLGAMVLMRGVFYGNMYNILGSTVINGCSNFIILEDKRKKIYFLLFLEKILCYGIKYFDMLKRRVFKIYKVKVWLKLCPNENYILISMSIVYMVKKIE